MRHCFGPQSPEYLNLVQLDGQQCSSAKVHPYAYPQHMNMFKCFLNLKNGCGGKVSGVVQSQPCQQFIVSPNHPHITLIWVNLMASSVTIQGCTHMPIHSIWTCSNTFYIYNTDVEIKWVELYSLNHANTSLFAPPSPQYPNLVQLDGQQCNSARVHPYAYPQHMNMLKHFLYIQYWCGEEVSGVVQP